MDKNLKPLTDQELEQANGGTKAEIKHPIMTEDKCSEIADQVSCVAAKCTWKDDFCKTPASAL